MNAVIGCCNSVSIYRSVARSHAQHPGGRRCRGGDHNATGGAIEVHCGTGGSTPLTTCRSVALTKAKKTSAAEFPRSMGLVAQQTKWPSRSLPFYCVFFTSTSTGAQVAFSFLFSFFLAVSGPGTPFGPSNSSSRPPTSR